jgi:squalene-hopene/tetraprenyl-beta-curcumene cyclase
LDGAVSQGATHAAAPGAAGPGPIGLDVIEAAIGRAASALLATQRPDGHFVFELEADVSIPAEYILFRHFLGDPAPGEIESKIGAYLRRTQADHGGWALVAEGKFNISSSVKAYFALKVIGDGPDAPHMRRARDAILAQGGAAATNVFTRSLLALYGTMPWRGVPVMPIEIMHLPRWFPFHLTKISYWGRTVLVPLMVVNCLKPLARNPRKVTIDELFVTPPDSIRQWPGSPHQSPFWTRLFGAIDWVLRRTEPYFPKRLRASAIDKAVQFVTERLNGEDGLGAIYPAMAYSAMMFEALGVPRSDPRVRQILAAIEKLLVVKDDEAYCQPCVSPVWDTALACHALMETGPATSPRVRAALDWLAPLQITDVCGDWAMTKPHVRPGGWAFQYANPYYPDLDDTAVVAMAMDRAAGTMPEGCVADHRAAIARAREWIEGMQSADGGFGAFDADNDHEYLNYIPFADHGALLDPPTADVTARCISLLGQLGERPERNLTLQRAMAYLAATQEKDGSWFGRWGMNYIYGTWSVLCALNAVEIGPDDPMVKRAVDWLVSIQNPDGGWGEDAESYAMNYAGYSPAPSTSSQTAWALLGLMAAGIRDGKPLEAGVSYLARTQGGDGFWQEARFTATGFPRVFFLRYHGYAKFFPLWALARYRNLVTGNRCPVLNGM